MTCDRKAIQGKHSLTIPTKAYDKDLADLAAALRQGFDTD
jgi:hypothetical protein